MASRSLHPVSMPQAEGSRCSTLVIAAVHAELRRELKLATAGTQQSALLQEAAQRMLVSQTNSIDMLCGSVINLATSAGKHHTQGLQPS